MNSNSLKLIGYQLKSYPLILAILQRIHFMLSWKGYTLCYPSTDTRYAILQRIHVMLSWNGYTLCYPSTDTRYAILERIHVMLSFNGNDLCYPTMDTDHAILQRIRIRTSYNGYESCYPATDYTDLMLSYNGYFYMLFVRWKYISTACDDGNTFICFSYSGSTLVRPAIVEILL
jgi:hypothetical protein